jgi:protein involved in polysaccharide export with SLBB domain
MGLPAPEFTPWVDALTLRSGTVRLPGNFSSAPLEMRSAPNSYNQGPYNQNSYNQDSYNQGAYNPGAPALLNSDSANGSSADPAAGSSPDSSRSAQTGTLAGARNGNGIEKQSALLRPGSQTDWSYAVIERVDTDTMNTTLIPFDLGKLVLEHDATQDLPLQPGDIVTVFSQDDIHQPMDRQTKYVRLEGEFVHPGVYSAAPGETLRALVARAGGLTDKAYLYGSEFTRQSTKAIEQQRLREYADRLEHQMARSAIAASNAGNSAPQPGQLEQVASVSREMILRLRQLRPTGRIVLDLKPASARGDDLPEASLEDGDRLLVPSTPATIQVIGAVLNQNAFLYRDHARVGEYMKLAGGPNRDADRKETFVLRADGSVNSHHKGETLFSSSSFENLHLNPGDTIIVPEKNIGPSALREFLSWSQLFSQVALGAAAIDIIK